VDAEEITISDRLALDDLLTRYATAIDTLDFDLLDTVFMPEAHLDYRSAGGIEGTYADVRKWLSDVLPIFAITQHLVVNRAFKLHGGEVHATSSFLNVNQLKVDGKPWMFTVGGRYRDRLVESTVGWRIARRLEETLWWENPMPGLPESPYPIRDSSEG
jgi:hypothetical protein